MVADSKTTGFRDNFGGGGIGITLECWNCVGVHLKRNCPKRAEEKEKKYDGGANNKRAEVKEGQLHAMFTSLMDVQSGIYFSDLGEDDEFTWHQFHVEVWGAQDF